jgi:hypothetical protein
MKFEIMYQTGGAIYWSTHGSAFRIQFCDGHIEIRLWAYI